MTELSPALYPLTIEGSAEDKITHASVPLVARRTGEIEDGCEVYFVPIPMPGSWMAAGRVVLHFDMVPGRSTFRLQFGVQA
jgi:hypothetical protein